MNYEVLKNKITGVCVVMVTPFDKNEEIDLGSVKSLTNYLTSHGIQEGKGMIVTTGSTGECFSMTHDEREKVFSQVIEEANGKAPVFVGCNETSARGAIDLAKRAERAGADGIMVMAPYYGPASNEQILDFYQRIAAATDLGIMIYNNQVVSTDIPLDVLHELAEIDRIVALKDCTQNVVKFQITARELGEKLVPLNGNNELWEPMATLSGTRGYVTLAGNFAPDLTMQLWEACEQGDFVNAEALSQQFTEYVRFQIDTDKPVQCAKFIMRELGIAGGYPRTPLIDLSPSEVKRMPLIMNEMGLKGK
jgi:4-hydroxy-tetrahydrodipicolinate synthase